MPDSQPRYPDCTVQLSDSSANAVAIFRKVRRELINYLTARGWERSAATMEGDAFQTEATSGDYGHVLITCHRWVNVV